MPFLSPVSMICRRNRRHGKTREEEKGMDDRGKRMKGELVARNSEETNGKGIRPQGKERLSAALTKERVGSM